MKCKFWSPVARNSSPENAAISKARREFLTHNKQFQHLLTQSPCQENEEVCYPDEAQQLLVGCMQDKLDRYRAYFVNNVAVASLLVDFCLLNSAYYSLERLLTHDKLPVRQSHFTLCAKYGLIDMHKLLCKHTTLRPDYHSILWAMRSRHDFLLHHYIADTQTPFFQKSCPTVAILTTPRSSADHENCAPTILHPQKILRWDESYQLETPTGRPRATFVDANMAIIEECAYLNKDLQRDILHQFAVQAEVACIDIADKYPRCHELLRQVNLIPSR